MAFEGSRALAGFQIGGSNALGDVIRSLLADARQKNLIGFQQQLQTQGALNLAQLQGDVAGSKTKQVFRTTQEGEAIPITFGLDEAGQPVTEVPKGTQVFGPRESLSPEAKRKKAAKDTEEAIIQEQINQRLQDRLGTGAAVPGAAPTNGAATPASTFVNESLKAAPTAGGQGTIPDFTDPAILDEFLRQQGF